MLVLISAAALANCDTVADAALPELAVLEPPDEVPVEPEPEPDVDEVDSDEPLAVELAFPLLVVETVEFPVERELEVELLVVLLLEAGSQVKL